MHVILNPGKKFQACKWIVEEYTLVIFDDEKETATSINKDEFKLNVKHNEELKEFLTLTLTQKGIEKRGPFRKAKYNTYASIVEIGKKTIQKQRKIKKNHSQRV